MKEEKLFKALFFKFSLLALSLYPGNLSAEDEIGLNLNFFEKSDSVDSYKINFNNVPIAEYIRFVSKITGTNFVFEEDDLQFNVTIVSEEPISTKNIMSALIQVLRIHGLTLLEQENNLLITKSAAVNQIPTIISPDVLLEHEEKAPLVTRIFRIKNANPTTIAGLIKPMVSASALIEVSTETRQLIVTDILTNVDKIAQILVTLDTPHSPLEIETYVAKNISPMELIALGTQIVTPFAEGHPLLLVPQLETNTIFIVSTPYLIERAMAVLEDLDAPISKSKRALSGGPNFLVYQPKNQSGEELQKGMYEIGKRLESSGLADPSLLKSLERMKWVPATNSLLFTGDADTLKKVEELVIGIDIPGDLMSSEAGFFLYKLLHAQAEVVLENLEKIADELPHKDPVQASFKKTIENTKLIKESNSLLISGSASNIEKVKELIAQFDMPGTLMAHEKSSFFIYKPLHQGAIYIQDSLKTLGTDLEESGLIDPDLLQTLKTSRYVSATNTLLFTGTPESLQKTQDLLQTTDVVAPDLAIQHIGKLTFLIYKLQHVSATQFITSMHSVAVELEKSSALDKELAKTLKTVKWVKETNSILFTGTPQSLERVETFIRQFDVPTSGKTVPLTYVLYNPKYVTGPDLISILCTFEKNLVDSGVSDQALFEAIGNLKWMQETSSLIITGDAETIKKVEQLLMKFDIPSAAGGTPEIESFIDRSFLVYKLQYHQGSDILTAIKQVAQEIGNSQTAASQDLVAAISSLQWINVTNSLIATGEQDVLTKLRDLIENLDVPLRQVFIEVLILETTLANTMNFGLQWGSLSKYKDKFALGGGNFPATNPLTNTPPPALLAPGLRRVNATTFPNPNTDIPFVQGFDLGSIGDLIFHKGRSFISLGALVNALQTDADSTIVMNPKIITQDTNNSTIFIGQNVPYVGSTQNIQGAANSTTSNIEYRDIGMNLSITPYLGNADIITLEISNDLSTQISPAPGQTIPQGGILTTHTSLNTRVHVPNEHFVVLSGMIHDTKTHFTSGIPCLGGLPVIGAAFSQNDRTNAKDNLIIFIRPHIITSFEEYKKITEHQEALYKDDVLIPRLKEQFDEGVNLVKQPENE